MIIIYYHFSTKHYLIEYTNKLCTLLLLLLLSLFQQYYIYIIIKLLYATLNSITHI